MRATPNTGLLAAAASLALLSACRHDTPRLDVGPHPADATAPTADRRYRSVTGDARDYRVVEPKPWAKLNQDVTPKKKK